VLNIRSQSSREGFRYANDDENDLVDFLYWCSCDWNARARLCATSPSDMERVPARLDGTGWEMRAVQIWWVALTGVVVTAGAVVTAGVVVVGIPGMDAHRVRRCRVDVARLTDGTMRQAARLPWRQATSGDEAALGQTIQTGPETQLLTPHGEARRIAAFLSLPPRAIPREKLAAAWANPADRVIASNAMAKVFGMIFAPWFKPKN
jgi:hypothetical protein